MNMALVVGRPLCRLSYCVAFAGMLVLSSHLHTGAQAKEQVLRASAGAYKAEVRLGRLTPSDLDPPTGWWGGPEPGSTYVKGLRVTKGRTQIVVPRSCFSDLANVRDVSAKLVRGGCVILISGADAGEGYGAEITIAGAQVSSRVVRPNEFSEYSCDKTTYIRKMPPAR